MTQGLPSKSVMDARFRQKLAARASGTVPVLADVPQEPLPEDLDQKAREKLARHRKQGSAQVTKQAEKETAKPVESPKPEERKPEEANPSRESGESRGQHQQHHHRRR